VEDKAHLEDICDAVAAEPRYAFDTEFHTEKTFYPQLALIQLGWADRVALIDPLAVDPGPLAQVFGGPGIAVGHAADQDLDVLETACGVAPPVVYDTQVAAGFLGMSTPSLARLVDQVLGISLPKADRLSDWLKRPITPQQETYAAGDVIHLIALWNTMAARLEELGRLQWAIEECALMLPGRRRRAVPEETWWKMGDIRNLSPRSRGVAQEVAAWRERKAADMNRPRRSVMSDLALATVAQRPPKNRDELSQLRGVDGRHLAGGGAAEILAAVQRGLDLPASELRLPSESREAQASPAAVAICSGVVRQIADDHQFDQGLLATRADLANFLCDVPSRLDLGWRSTLVGDPIRRLVGGELSAAFRPNGSVVLEPRTVPG
jgi:ribonuclease D